ncbi:hypothetical protein TcCL_NonESM03353 [Trypanosoma cruzi]|nr:hypothetical protein TcCL_NonESM03353 [Trypanosoma cruzi]
MWKCRRATLSPARWSYGAEQRMASAWALHSVAGVRSACRPSLSSSLKWRAVVPVEFPAAPAHQEKLTFHSAWERVMPRTLAMCVTTLARQPRRLPHTGQSAGRRIVAGWGSAGGGGVSVRGSLRACCAASELHQQHVLGMAGYSGRSSHPYLCRTPVRRRASAASTARVRVASARVGPSRRLHCSSKLRS